MNIGSQKDAHANIEPRKRKQIMAGIVTVNDIYQILSLTNLQASYRNKPYMRKPINLHTTIILFLCRKKLDFFKIASVKRDLEIVSEDIQRCETGNVLKEGLNE
uniref:Uncharacterized protein n=1 Tax=Romanomermis culicivorax TaxID=13658 RepID=A0A915K5F4_ROMCU